MGWLPIQFRSGSGERYRSKARKLWKFERMILGRYREGLRRV
jgi:hypothetical protein